ncbi:alpha/beta hydrolase [bacterium]|nr:alpha/beta hydrolase [bacterium]
MSFITAKDGAKIFYKDWGQGRPVVLSHGWPLNADAWDEQLHFLASQGFRAIAHDRRGHGRSDQTWEGHHMDGYADDLAALVEQLQLQQAVHVGHSTGGGEVVRYLGRHGTGKAAGAVLVGAVPPLMLKTESNPEGLPLEAFDSIRQGVSRDRSQFYKDLTTPFFGGKASAGQVEQFWLMSMQVGLKAALDCIKAFSETDFRPDLQRLDVPTLFIHGDADQIVPIGAAALNAHKLVPDSQLKVYAGGDHALAVTHRDRFHADLLEFLKGL